MTCNLRHSMGLRHPVRITRCNRLQCDSYGWCESFTLWLYRVACVWRDVTRSYVTWLVCQWHDIFIWSIHILWIIYIVTTQSRLRVTWRDLFVCTWRDSFICVETRSYMRFFIFMNHSHFMNNLHYNTQIRLCVTRRDSFIAWHDSVICDKTHWWCVCDVIHLHYNYTDSPVCDVTWLVHMDVSQSCVTWLIDV